MKLSSAREAQPDLVAAAETGDVPPRLHPALVILCVIVAFRGALLLQQVLLLAAARAEGCTGASLQSSFTGTKVTGIDACSGSGWLVALVGVFGVLLVAVPLLVAFRALDGRISDGSARPMRTRTRVLVAVAYLLALAAIAEAIAGATILAVAAHGESALLVGLGIPVLLLVLIGVAIGVLAYPTLRSTSHLFVVHLLGHGTHHVDTMQKAVIVKLTVGVCVISAARLVLG